MNSLQPSKICTLKPLYLRHAYDDLILGKLVFLPFTELRPPDTVELIRHEFDNNDPSRGRRYRSTNPLPEHLSEGSYGQTDPSVRRG